MAYPTTDKEYVAKLKLAASQKTKYWNQYPYNLGYYHSDGYFSFDCVNLNKAILNGWECNKTVGYFVKDLSRTGDCNEWGFISQCEYSGDFTKMNCVAALYMDGHIGNYIHEEIEKNGHIYNCIECTGSWGGGVLYSYVDSGGRRYNHKGGTQNGAWAYWGKMTKWLKYVAKSYPEVPFSVKVLIDDLNIRKGAGTEYGVKGYASKGNHIVDKVKNGFGYVKNLDGWIFLDNENYVTIGGHIVVSPFKDVKIGDPAYNAIMQVAEAGIMNGYSDGKFRPNKKVTRKMMAIVIAKTITYVMKMLDNK